MVRQRRRNCAENAEAGVQKTEHTWSHARAPFSWDPVIFTDYLNSRSSMSSREPPLQPGCANLLVKMHVALKYFDYEKDIATFNGCFLGDMHCRLDRDDRSRGSADA